MDKRRSTTGSGHGPRVKPAKPYPGFPLFPHATGRWAKKIRGRFAFFGPWDDWRGALERFLDTRDELYAGRPVAARAAGRPEAPAGGAMATVAQEDRPSSTGGRRPGAVPDARPRVGGGIGRVATVARRDPASGAAPGPARDPTSRGPTLRDLANHYLTAKQRRLEAGELGLRAFDEAHRACRELLECLGRDTPVDAVRPDDFARLRQALAARLGPVALGNAVSRVRSVFRHGLECGLTDRPARFGPEFRKPPRRTVRLARRTRGKLMFSAAELRTVLAAAGPQMRAMVLLGINCGLGNTDIGSLRWSDLDLDACRLEFPRPKTGIARRATLWEETANSLRALRGPRYTRVRRDGPGASGTAANPPVFLTKYGHPWVRVEPPGPRSLGRSRAVVKDAVAGEFGKLLRSLGLERDRRGFYALRHTFRTVADEVPDRRAVDLVMGHEDGGDISTAYVERIADSRLEAVARHVRAWLGDLGEIVATGAEDACSGTRTRRTAATGPGSPAPGRPRTRRTTEAG